MSITTFYIVFFLLCSIPTCTCKSHKVVIVHGLSVPGWYQGGEGGWGAHPNEGIHLLSIFNIPDRASSLLVH